MKPNKYRGFHTFEPCNIREWVYGYYFKHPEADRHSIFTDGKGSRIVDKESVQQFVGLYDKNNQEIYEGDVVIHKFRRIWQTELHTSVVIWDQKYCCYYLFDGISNHRMRDDIIYEVIGNIYSNPELIK